MGARVRLRFLGLMRHLAGVDSFEVEFNSEPTLEEVLEALRREMPSLYAKLKEMERRGIAPLFILNGTGISKGDRLHDGSEVIVLHPTSGG